MVLLEDLDKSIHLELGSDMMPALHALLNAACLCNNATLTESIDNSCAEGFTGAALSGQPTELALLVAAVKAKVGDVRPQYHRVQEVPFTSDRKSMEVKARPINGLHACAAITNASSQPNLLGRTPSNVDGSLFFIKGMPEKVIAECSSYCLENASFAPLDNDNRSFVLVEARRMAATGLRVISVAYGQVMGNLIFAGLIGMEDPPRQGVVESVMNIRRSGVKVLMVTGDCKETAITIAHRCGILGSIEPKENDKVYNGLLLTSESDHSSDMDLRLGCSTGSELNELEFGVSSQALSGAELDSISPQNLADSIGGVKVFYRVAPRHKLAIVRARKFKNIIAHYFFRVCTECG